MESGFDVSSLMKQNEEKETEANVECEEITRNKRERVSSLTGKKVPTTESNEKKPTSSDDPNEENRLLKSLEASSKGAVKESVLWSYLKSANQPFTLFCLIVFILLAQILVSMADIWIAFW